MVLGNVEFCRRVAFETAFVMLQMFFVKVREHGDFGRRVGEFQLVRRHFDYRNGVFREPLQRRKDRHADVAYQSAIFVCGFEHFVSKRGGRRLAFRAGHADFAAGGKAQKQIHLAGHFRAGFDFDCFKRNAGAFEHDVILVDGV